MRHLIYMNFHWTDAAKPAPSLEKEVHIDCLSCGDAILHPLCPQCITNQFWHWIAQYRGERTQLLEKLKEFHESHARSRVIHPTCASCNKTTTSVCPHCFTTYLYSLVKEAGIGVRAMSEFLFMFNFDFEHKGYSQDLEAFGGY